MPQVPAWQGDYEYLGDIPFQTGLGDGLAHLREQTLGLFLPDSLMPSDHASIASDDLANLSTRDHQADRHQLP